MVTVPENRMREGYWDLRARGMAKTAWINTMSAADKVLLSLFRSEY